MALTKKDIKAIERAFYKVGMEIAAAQARSAEQLDQQIDGAKYILLSRMENAPVDATTLNLSIPDEAQARSEDCENLRDDM